MSLIHDALKSMDAPEHAMPARAVRASRGEASGRSAWVYACLAFVVVVGVGALGWYVWRAQMQLGHYPASVAVAPASVLAPMQPVVQAPIAMQEPTQTLLAPTAAAVSEGSENIGAQANANLQKLQVLDAASPDSTASSSVSETASPRPPAQSPMASEVAARQQPDAQVVRSEKKAAIRKGRSVAKAPVVAAPEPVVDDTPVALQFAHFVAAMRTGQTVEAERVLAALEERLPAGSLGLLRAQAWFHLRKGEDNAAADIYRTVLGRMPGDEEAAINLASIQSRKQRHEEARATLADALRLQPDSAALRAALAQFTPNARQ